MGADGDFQSVIGTIVEIQASLKSRHPVIPAR
jgi:hypothetical protein